VGVSLVDYYLIRKQQLDSKLETPSQGKTIHASGINAMAWIAVVIGTTVAVLLPNTLPVSLIALLLSGAVYYAGMKLRKAQTTK